VARVQSITGGKGARIVFDPVGGDYINTLAQATANGGTIFLYGMLSGKPTPFPWLPLAEPSACSATPSANCVAPRSGKP
jgi:NADPH:quinone reductase-like Zn-dependent oxidoreductase